MKNLKNHIDEKLSGVKMDYVLSDKILDETVYSEAKSERKTRGGFTKKVIAAVCCVCLLTSATAVAANSQAMKDFFEKLHSDYSDSIVDINKSVVIDGIEMNVISAYNDSRQNCVYFSLRDLTGDRIDESTEIEHVDIYDEDNHPRNGYVSSRRLISFDEETKTAYFMQRSWSEEKIRDTLHLTVKDVYSGMERKQYLSKNVNLADIVKENPEIDPKSGGKNLKKDVMNIPVTDGDNECAITNAGIIDGQLHIQIKWSGCYRCLTDLCLIENPDGIELEPAEREFGSLKEKATGNEIQLNKVTRITYNQEGSENEKLPIYDEYIFNINDPEGVDLNKLGDYNLWLYRKKWNCAIKGEWKIPYKVKTSENIKLTNVNGKHTDVEISQIAMYVLNDEDHIEYVEKIRNADDDFSSIVRPVTQAKIVLKNGEEIEFRIDDEGAFGAYYYQFMCFKKELNLDDVQSVILKGREIYSNK